MIYFGYEMKRLYVPALVPFLFLAGSLAYLVPLLVVSRQPARATVATTFPIASSTPQSLAYYAAAERLDPIFAIEGTDPAKLANAVTVFLAEGDEIASTYRASQRPVIEQTLYPAAFLTDLPKLEEARQALLTEPTAARASTYHYLLMQTVSDYALDARALASSLASAGAHIPSIGYLGGEASTTYMAAQMNRAADLTLQQKQKEAARFACLVRLSGNCTPLATLANARNTLLRASVAVPAPSASVYKADAINGQALAFYKSLSAISKTIFAIPTDCYPEPVAYEREYYLAPYEGGEARKLEYINDLYFYDVPREANGAPTNPLYVALQKVNVSVQYQSIGNLYECPDSGLDVAEAGSLLGVLNLLGQKASTTPAEQKLLALPVVQKADLAPYVQAAAKQDTPQGETIVERYIEGSADFDQVVLGASHDNLFLLTKDRTQQASLDYLLSARNFASTLFLFGNPTFVPQRISLFSKTVPSPLNEMYLREYLNDVSKQYTDVQLMLQIKNSMSTEGVLLGLLPHA